MPATPHLAIFVSFSGQGGVEPMMLNLAGALARLGCRVDLVRPRPRGEHRPAPESVNVITLPCRHTRTCRGPLTRYLRQNQPDALIASKDRGNRVAIAARRKSGLSLPVAVRFDTTISAAFEGKSRLKKWLRLAPMKRIYPQADVVIAVSEGVRQDAAKLTGLPAERIERLPYPVVTDQLYQQAQAPTDHPWLQSDRPRAEPVILGVGRLTRQKDFPTLIEAFARLRQQQPAKLIILGDGEQRAALQQQIEARGLSADVDLPGFATNPYPIMSRADLFVLSSRWEGSPIVLTEALALGTPAVSTDCPSGPQETLDAGRVGPLVAMGDAAGLAEAMSQTLAQPPEAETLQAAAAPFTDRASAEAHLRVLGLSVPSNPQR
jgi:glycosyltransferase involved in cell wall biosynthesis